MLKMKSLFLKILFSSLLIFTFSDIIVQNTWGDRVIRMKEMIIKGRVQKPQAMYILQRSTHVTFKTSIENKREDFRLYIINEIRDNPTIFEPKIEKKGK